MSALLAMSGAREPRGDVIFRPEDNGGAERHIWIVPAGVYSICAVIIDRGADWQTSSGSNKSNSGSGGDLRWMNNISVTPGEELNVWIMSNPNSASCLRRSSVDGKGLGTIIMRTDSLTGGGGRWGGGFGASADSANYYSLGGGGAGGYAGTGGAGGAYRGASGSYSPTGGGGGGGGGGDGRENGEGGNPGCRGGSTYIYGQGASGLGGSPGGDGSVVAGKSGRVWGGGGGGGKEDQRAGVLGIARILWGAGRAFPSTAVSTSTD